MIKTSSDCSEFNLPASIGSNVSRRKFLRDAGTAVAAASVAGLVSTTGAAGAVSHASQIGYDQSLRPQFHFTARTGWINDPNGLVYVNGIYHLFFQHNPFGIQWGHMTWGHAISHDLVHWRQLAEAIRPDSMGPIYSGSAAVDTHNTSGLGTGTKPPVIAMYTAAGGSSRISKGKPYAQCIAYSNDGGFTFTKYQHNPVLNQLVTANRDPKIIWYAPTNRWIMALYLDASHGFGLFSSPDLKHWTKFQELPFPQSSECPNFFPLSPHGMTGENRWIFTGANSQYLIGRFDGRRFTPESGPFAMDTGNGFYAAQVYNDIPKSDGRTIQIAWMHNGRYPGMPFNQQMSFPCALTLRDTPDGLRVCREPVREIQHLWAHSHRMLDMAIAGKRRELSNVTGNQLDIEAIIQPGSARVVGMEICGQTIEVNYTTGQIHCLGATGQFAKAGHPRTPLHLRILVDRTSIEVFAQHGLVSMSSCYLPPAHRTAMACYAVGGNAVFSSLAIRKVHSAWKQS